VGKSRRGFPTVWKTSQSSREWYKSSIPGEGIVYMEKEKENVTRSEDWENTWAI
jgi:hypothetical protein